MSYHLIRERVASGELEMIYIPTEDMVADDFTKALSTDKHQKHLIGMGLSE